MLKNSSCTELEIVRSKFKCSRVERCKSEEHCKSWEGCKCGVARDREKVLVVTAENRQGSRKHRVASIQKTSFSALEQSEFHSPFIFISMMRGKIEILRRNTWTHCYLDNRFVNTCIIQREIIRFILDSTKQLCLVSANYYNNVQCDITSLHLCTPRISMMEFPHTMQHLVLRVIISVLPI